MEEVKLVEIDRAEEWEVEKKLNKRKIRGVVKYLVQQKGFTTESNIWEKKENLKNTKEVVVKFEERLSAEVRRQEKLELVEEQDFKRGKLPEIYIAKILYEWNNEEEYLRKLERNWQK